MRLKSWARPGWGTKRAAPGTSGTWPSTTTAGAGWPRPRAASISRLPSPAKGEDELPGVRRAAIVAADPRPARGAAARWSPRKATGRPIGARGEIPYRLVPGQALPVCRSFGPGRPLRHARLQRRPPFALPWPGGDARRTAICRTGRNRSSTSRGRWRRSRSPAHSAAAVSSSGRRTRPSGSAALFAARCWTPARANCSSCRRPKAGRSSFPCPSEAKGVLRRRRVYRHRLLAPRACNWRASGIPWNEYLLYNEQIGFRWLECSDRPLELHRAAAAGQRRNARQRRLLGGKRFRWFQKGEAEVKAVVGEILLEGRRRRAGSGLRFHPPAGIALPRNHRIRRRQGRSQLVAGQISAGQQKWNGPLSSPNRSRAQHDRPQPALSCSAACIAYGACLCSLPSLCWVCSSSHRPPRSTVFENDYQVTSAATSDEGQVFFGGPLGASMPAAERGDRGLDDSHELLALDRRRSGRRKDRRCAGIFAADGVLRRAWRTAKPGPRGAAKRHTYLSALPEGDYSLRLEVHGDPKNPPLLFNVRVRQDVPRLVHWLLAMLAVSLIPLAILGYQISFESRRWQTAT